MSPVTCSILVQTPDARTRIVEDAYILPVPTHFVEGKPVQHQQSFFGKRKYEHLPNRILSNAAGVALYEPCREK